MIHFFVALILVVCIYAAAHIASRHCARTEIYTYRLSINLDQIEHLVQDMCIQPMTEPLDIKSIKELTPQSRAGWLKKSITMKVNVKLPEYGKKRNTEHIQEQSHLTHS